MIHLWVLLASLVYNGLTILHVRIHDHPRVGLHHFGLAIDRIDTSLDYMNAGFSLIIAIMVLVMLAMMLVYAIFNVVADREEDEAEEDP